MTKSSTESSITISSDFEFEVDLRDPLFRRLVDAARMEHRERKGYYPVKADVVAALEVAFLILAGGAPLPAPLDLPLTQELELCIVQQEFDKIREYMKHFPAHAEPPGT